MSTACPVQPQSIRDEDYDRLETAIVTILRYYHGAYEESLQDWYRALKLVVPRLCAPEELTTVFRRLSISGIIQLRKATTGVYSGRNDDAAFFHAGAFTTALAPRRAIHGNSIRLMRSHPKG